MKKRIIALLCISIMTVMVFTGCKKDSDKGSAKSESKYTSALEVLETVWNKYEEADKFSALGGSMAIPVDSAPGKVEATDKDTLSFNLLIPEDIQGSVKDAASLIHMLNANSFTGGVVKVDGDIEKFVSSLKEGILGNHFLCGFPEKLVIFTTGDYVGYAFGTEDLVSNFESVASKNIEGVKVEVSQLFE